MPVPFNDFSRALPYYWGGAWKGMRRCIERTRFLRGPAVEAMEAGVAAACGVKRAVAVSSGTDALKIALRAAGVSDGRAVVTPAFGCRATVSAIIEAGGRPCFVDVDPSTGLSRAEDWAESDAPHPKVFLPVHLYGRQADVGAARREAGYVKGAIVIEDACQGWGLPRLCAESVAAAMSFYPSKNLGAWGDAGAVLTNDLAFAQECEALRNYGSDDNYDIKREGWNSRCDEFQAAVIVAKLPYERGWREQRARAANLYRSRLPNALLGSWRGVGNHHLFPIFFRDGGERAAVRSALTARGIQTEFHYPRALTDLSMWDCGRSHGARAALCAARELSLPMFPGIKDGEVHAVCDAVVTSWEESQKSRRNLLDMPMHAG